MRGITKKLTLALAAGAMMLGASGCYYGINNFTSYSGASQIRTTAAPESVEEFSLKQLRAKDGCFEMEGLPWGSTFARFQEFFGTTVSETNSFTDGEFMADINYSYKLADALTVGVQPVFDKEGHLMSLSLYYQTTYTPDRLDEIYGKLVDQAEKEFGEKEKEEAQETQQDRTVYRTNVSYWYADRSETEQTSLQIGTLNTGAGTEAVVIGINCYDPAVLETETESESVGE